jgi:hypothetical protein
MASTTGRRLVEYLTNKSGGSVAAGDVVIVDTSNNDAFTTTTSAGVTVLVGVAQEAIANNAAGRVCTGGYVPLVNVNASVTRGNYGKTHTVAKQATDAGSSRVAGAFCQFLTGGTTPTAHLFGFTDVSAGSLTDHTHAATGSGATGGGATLNPTSLSPSGLIAFNSGIDSTVNADQNDFNPANFHTVAEVRFTSFSANRTVTGMDAGATGELKILLNNTSFSLLLTNESGSSSANNRFRTPNAATVTVRTSGSVMCFYYAGRWTVIGA